MSPRPQRVAVEADTALGEQPARLGARDAERVPQQRREVHVPAVGRERVLLDLVRHLARDVQAVEVRLGRRGGLLRRGTGR